MSKYSLDQSRYVRSGRGDKRGSVLPGEHNLSSIGSLVRDVLDAGYRSEGVSDTQVVRLCPTNSERMNRSLVELSGSAFKIHMLLWKWRGAPARGKLPFFTIRSLAKFCNLTRPTVRSGLSELIDKGWIQRLGYSRHAKNELYRLIPIREIPRPDGK